MAQFVARMNLLCNKQVLGILFILKINFCIYLPILYILWTGPRIPEKSGAKPEFFPKTQITATLGVRVYS
jgi:hypothetical protein